MAHLKIAILFLVFSLLGASASHAAFPARKFTAPAGTAPDSAAYEGRQTYATPLATRKPMSFSAKLKAAMQLYRQRDTMRGNTHDTGVFGILSFICAALSLISVVVFVSTLAFSIGSLLLFLLWPLLAIAAIVLGIIGCGRGRKLKGLAIAGLALGILSLLPLIFAFFATI